jgi:hypothetical protein
MAVHTILFLYFLIQLLELDILLITYCTSAHIQTCTSVHYYYYHVFVKLNALVQLLDTLSHGRWPIKIHIV